MGFKNGIFINIGVTLVLFFVVLLFFISFLPVIAMIGTGLYLIMCFYTKMKRVRVWKTKGLHSRKNQFSKTLSKNEYSEITPKEIIDVDYKEIE